MPPANRRNSQDIIADLLSEARHLVSRERTTEEDNLLQLQQVIEAAQRELRRLRLHAEGGRLRVREDVQTDVGENTGMHDFRGRRGETNDTERDSSPDDGSGGVISAMVRVGQINITHPGENADLGNQTRAEDNQTNGPPTELDLNLGEGTDWMLAGLDEVLQQLPENEARGRLAEPVAGLPLVQTGRAGTDEEAPPNHDTGNSGPNLSSGSVGVPTDQDGIVQLTRREDGNTSIESSAIDGTPGVPSGRSMLYTELSRPGREESFVNFTDAARRAAASNAANPGNRLHQMSRGDDTWVIRLPLETERESLSQGAEQESNDSSEEDLDALTPLPSPPPSPPLRSHETASLSSTAATAGSEFLLEEAGNGSKKEEQMCFSKERKAQLMAAMNADIARYSQGREWEYYRQHGYGVLPRIHYPEPAQNTEPLNAHTSGRTNREMGNEVFARTVADALARLDDSILTSAEMQFIRLVSQGEEFLAYLLQLPNLIDVAVRQPYFAEQYVHPRFGSLEGHIYSLVQEPEDVETARMEFDQMTMELFDRNRAGHIWAAVGSTGRGEGPIPQLMLRATMDGMSIREGYRLLHHCIDWWNSDAGRRSVREDPEGFLPMAVIQFWIALRRGWGGWTPSKEMLVEVRSILSQYTSYNYNGADGHPLPNDTVDQGILTMARTREIILESDAERRLFRLAPREQTSSEIRFYRLFRNWSTFPSVQSLDRTGVPQQFQSAAHFRLHRLCRLILEEAVINERRGTRSDGQWIEEQNDDVPESDV
ncbi:hypothetical protein V8E51_004820 [Hyaloscypha variabilis]